MKGLHKHPLSVLVWAGISKRGPTPILIFSGCMDSEFYISEILQNTLLKFTEGGYGGTDTWMLMQDNGKFNLDDYRAFSVRTPIFCLSDPKHTSRATQEFFKERGIRWWKTPAESPDINPIEKIWADLKRFLRAFIKPKTKDELIRGIETYWGTLTAEKCTRYVDNVRKVVAKIIENEGLPTGL